MSNLLAVVILGHEFDWSGPWSVSTTVLLLMLLQAALAVLALIVLALLLIRKCIISKSRQNILVTEAAKPAERELVGITLDTVVVQREFTVGEPFNCDGLIVTARYSSEPISETVTDFEVEKPPMYKPGKPTVTVKYGEFTAFYSISVEAVPVRNAIGISIDTSNVQTQFEIGEPFNYNGLIVSINYDKEPFYETTEDYTVQAPDTYIAGDYHVTVQCGALTDAYKITVAQPARKMTGIALDLSVVKTDFLIGEEFEYAGLGVVACYDTEPQEEPVYDYTVDAPDLSQKGISNVVVHYGEFSQSYPVFVSECRSLIGISLDLSVVRRDFTVGEQFNSAGLIVTANYDVSPMSEQIEDYIIAAPDMTKEGIRTVCVSYMDKTATYTISLAQPSPVPVAEESAEGVLRYDRSFTAKLIQADDETKQWYTVIKNELLSYKKVKARMSWKRETFRYDGNNVAKFGFRGKMLCLFLALDTAEYAVYADGRYKVEDVSMNKSFEDTPCMYRIKNDMRTKRACELIGIMMEKLGAQKFDRPAEDYYLPYEGIYELVNKGLAKRMKVSVEDFGSMSKSADEAAASATQQEAAPTPVIKKTERPVADVPVVAEESVEGGTLRYDKSFKAKLIQSEDETKKYYSDVKNELLSYKKVRDRLSWKRETYKAAGEVVARLSYRGSTLCLYLPLNVEDYAGTRYKVEDVSANKSYVDTPCMFRIKNDKRLRLAADLIATVMQARGIEKTPRQPEDFTEPYQDIVKLIEQGLVRREIKSKEEESLFNKGE